MTGSPANADVGGNQRVLLDLRDHCQNPFLASGLAAGCPKSSSPPPPRLRLLLWKTTTGAQEVGEQAGADVAGADVAQGRPAPAGEFSCNLRDGKQQPSLGL